jgi:hypothetical protein
MSIADVLLSAKKKAIRPVERGPVRARRPTGNKPAPSQPIDIGGGSVIVPPQSKGGKAKKKR